ITGVVDGIDALELIEQLSERRGESIDFGWNGRRMSEVKTLYEIGVRIHRDHRFELGFDTLHHDQRSGLMQQRYHARHNAADIEIACCLSDNRTVEFDNIWTQLPNAVEVRVAGAEIIDRD